MINLRGSYTGADIIKAFLEVFPGPKIQAREVLNEQTVHIQQFTSRRHGLLWLKKDWRRNNNIGEYIIHVYPGNQTYEVLQCDYIPSPEYIKSYKTSRGILWQNYNPPKGIQRALRWQLSKIALHPMH